MSYFVLYLIVFIAKFSFARFLLFNHVNIPLDIWVELPPVLAIFLIFELFKKGKSILYFLFNILYSTFLLALVLYDKEFGRIMTFGILSESNQTLGIKSSIDALFKPMYLLFFIDMIFIIILYFFKSKFFKKDLSFPRKTSIIFLCISMGLSFCNIYFAKDRNINTTFLAHDIGLSNLEIFDTYSKITKQSPKKMNITYEEIQKLKGNEIPEKPNYFGIAKNENVIAIQLESFQNFLINSKIDGQEITPNLNKIVKESLYFPYFYTQIGQGNTIDAEMMLNTSLYPLATGVVAKEYNDRDLPSLPKILNTENYQTVTFHVNESSFYNRNIFYPSLGFNHFYDKTFFGTEDTVGLGDSDEVLYSKAIPELANIKKEGKPFYANLITLSSHHPFVIPEGKINGFYLPEKYNGTTLGNYILAAKYTDEAIGVLFDGLKKENLLDNTVIVFYGDHFAFDKNEISDSEKPLLKEILGHNYDYADMYNIPLIIHIPNQSPMVVQNVGGEVDLMPTIANLLGISLQNKIYFGQDILNNGQNLLGLRYYVPEGSYINQDEISIYGESITDLKTHTTKPYAKTEQYQNVQKLTGLSDSFLYFLPKKTSP